MDRNETEVEVLVKVIEDQASPFCEFFLTKKRRNCKMRVKKGALYCAEHLTSTLESGEEKRIPCPLDPAHSVYESKLKAHLKKCNARNPEIVPSYFSKDLNTFGDDCDEVCGSGCGAAPSIADLVERIDKIAEKYRSFIPESLKDDGKCPQNASEKHRLQQDALSKLILEKIDPVRYEKVVVIEFGAGKGGLSSFLWESYFMKQLENISSEFILIDRKNFRCKRDAKMKHEGATVKRIFVDIKDLNLDELLGGYDKEKTYFLWASKHLCGVATCLTLNSLLKTDVQMNGTFCVALCCHQCCSLQAYPNKAFLYESGLLKRGEEDVGRVFRMLCSITSWAVCGFRDDLQSDDDEEEEEEGEAVPGKRTKLMDDLDASDPISIFSVEKKESIGRKMKRLLDHGRELKLKTIIPECELKHYVGEEITLENAVLIGHTSSRI